MDEWMNDWKLIRRTQRGIEGAQMTNFVHFTVLPGPIPG